jgi:hypothetical protein
MIKETAIGIFKGPVESLRTLSTLCEGKSISSEVFMKTGVYVCRSLIKRETCENSLVRLKRSGALDGERNLYNAVSIATSPDLYRELWTDNNLLDQLEPVLGHDISMYGFRFVSKDEKSSSPVFLHNDICYHKGGFNRVSAFVALTPSTESNGYMEFFPGTHHFGYLGDAGELSEASLQAGWPKFSPSLGVGDVVIMHSALWHRSAKNTSGELRVLADIHFQPSSDPTGLVQVRGTLMSEYSVSHVEVEKAFIRSRVSRIIDLEEQIKDKKRLEG